MLFEQKNIHKLKVRENKSLHSKNEEREWMYALIQIKNV